MKKFTKKESQDLKALVQTKLEFGSTDQDVKRYEPLIQKINSNTLKTIEQLDTTDLRELVYALMQDGAEVQGMKVEDFCLDIYNLEW